VAARCQHEVDARAGRNVCTSRFGRVVVEAGVVLAFFDAWSLPECHVELLHPEDDHSAGMLLNRMPNVAERSAAVHVVVVDEEQIVACSLSDAFRSLGIAPVPGPRA
jgi:hypothetical protein